MLGLHQEELVVEGQVHLRESQYWNTLGGGHHPGQFGNGFFIPEGWTLVLILIEQQAQRLSNIRFQSESGLFDAKRAQVDQVCPSGRQMFVEDIPGLAKDLPREKVSAVAVVAKSARFAQQAVNHVTVVDLVVVGAGHSRQGLNVLVGIPDLDVPFVDAGGDALAFQPAGDAVTIAAHPQNAILPDPHIQFAHLRPGFRGERFQLR